MTRDELRENFSDALNGPTFTPEQAVALSSELREAAALRVAVIQIQTLGAIGLALLEIADALDRSP